MIGRELGRGATGRVYVAEDAMLARPVAIKFIADLDAGARQRFLIEARVVARIHHPNVVGIYRVGTLQNRPYLVSELVRGVSLADLAKPVPWQRALDIAIGLSRGLAAVHRGKVVHCDLKPSNVMIDHDGLAKIIDFGLARPNADRASGGDIPVGTPDYMAPEVWRGESPSRRADVYALGAVLYELIAGTPPFGEIPAAALRERVTTGEAPALRDRVADVDPELAAVVARCLQRDRDARFADGDALREALERLHASRRHVVRAGENPYRGLLPFEATHRGVFFGRRSEIDAVVARLRGEPLVLVTGDSGVGKSSLCRAGVVPAVLDGELGGAWQALTLVPGHAPLTALAHALGEPALVPQLRDNPALLARELRRHAGAGELIVFIDQLEELVTLGDPGEVAALDAGLAGLVDGVPGLRVLATVRADFLARLSTLPGLGRDLSRLLYFLRPLPPERLRDVIVGPAAAVGGRFESDAIVDELIEATAQAGGGGLPLLSFALADLWEARERTHDVILRSAVTAMGGVAGALSRHADVVIGGMVADERVQARALLLRLVSAMGTRARRSADELALGGGTRGALDALVKGRLVVVHDGERAPEYELAHECLITDWSTLRQWLVADAAGRAARERLAAATAEWVRLDRRSDATWQGPRLAEAIAIDPASLSSDDRAFVAASRRANRQRRQQRGLAGLLAAVMIVLAFAVPRYFARRELDAAIAAELALARDARSAAQRAEQHGDQLARQAYAAFDARRNGAGEQLWKAAIAERDAAGHAYRTASRYVEAAFAKDSGRADARDLLGDIMLGRALLDDQVSDLGDRDEQLDRLPLYDADGSRQARWHAPGHLVVRAAPGAVITLESALPPARANPPEPPRRLGTGAADVQLPTGSYVVVVITPGRVDVRAPILLARGGNIALDLTTIPAAAPEGFVYVMPGVFLFGNANETDRLFQKTTPLRARTTAAYFIARTEITFAEWLTYIDALPPAERAARLPSVPLGVNGGLSLVADGAGHWKISLVLGARTYTAGWGEPIRYADRTLRERQDWRRFPAIGIGFEDVVAYAAWLDRTGRVPGARLCSEIEWERGARGADGRMFPGGRLPEGDDANFDDTYTRELMGPDEVGSHPQSRSPFALDDMDGNAMEWTVPEDPDEGALVRGGSYQYDLKTAQLPNRTAMPKGRHDTSTGARLCATPALPR